MRDEEISKSRERKRRSEEIPLTKVDSAVSGYPPSDHRLASLDVVLVISIQIQSERI